ncbi:hypothetical protein DL768_000815 [Monosporascus sp. mg162]|nr:hypothetical protein DL768_000815 [Monosporascus sp. mg162]
MVNTRQSPRRSPRLGSPTCLQRPSINSSGGPTPAGSYKALNAAKKRTLSLTCGRITSRCGRSRAKHKEAEGGEEYKDRIRGMKQADSVLLKRYVVRAVDSESSDNSVNSDSSDSDEFEDLSSTGDGDAAKMARARKELRKTEKSPLISPLKYQEWPFYLTGDQ